MATNSGISWDGFKGRQAAIPQGADLEKQLRDSIVKVKAARGRKPRSTPAAAAEPTVGDLLLQTIRMVSARKGKETREALVREATLLEVLGELMRGTA
jgi:hypothetical protein